MKDALRHSAAMLGELRTSLLGPQKYYELSVAVNDEMRSLETYFAEERSASSSPPDARSFADLYELVQHAGNVLPRLYLLCTVGACYIRSRQAPAKLILHDMADMCKGVQHPTRGIFLRAYLVQACRGLLPDSGSPYEGEEGGDVIDAVEFLLANFTEMNKLWVRMKHQGGPRGAEQREKERAQLADLVGKNLTQLSQLEGLNFELYRDVVLPRIVEQIVACKDELAQGYLMQCTAAVFPDEFHVGTLESLLEVLPQLQPGVKLASVMGSLMERLAAYAAHQPSVVADLDGVGAFSKMSAAAAKSVAEHPSMPAAELAAVYSGLLSFAGAVYPGRMDFVDEVLGSAQDSLKNKSITTDARAERQLASLLSSPIDTYGVVTVLGLRKYAPLLSLLSVEKQRDTGRRIAESLMASGDVIDTADKVEILFTFVQPLVGGGGGNQQHAKDEEEQRDDAAVLAKMVHSLKASNPDEQYRIVEFVLSKIVGGGGGAGVVAVVPPLFFIGIQTVQSSTPPPNEQKVYDDEAWYRLLHKSASYLVEVRAAPQALQLFLTAAATSSQHSHLPLVSYEFFEQAFTLFEESIPDSKQEVRALQRIVAVLHTCRVFDADNRGALVHKALSYCSKLLKRRDQCVAVLACAHLSWQEEVVEAVETEETETSLALYPPVRDPHEVVSCLKRALKIAHAAQQQLAVVERKGAERSGPAHLFVEILNAYLYFYDQGVETIKKDDIQSVLELVASEVGGEGCGEDEGLQVFYERTVAHVKHRQDDDNDDDGKYRGLVLKRK